MLQKLYPHGLNPEAVSFLIAATIAALIYFVADLSTWGYARALASCPLSQSSTSPYFPLLPPTLGKCDARGEAEGWDVALIIVGGRE